MERGRHGTKRKKVKERDREIWRDGEKEMKEREKKWNEGAISAWVNYNCPNTLDCLGIRGRT